MHPPRVGFSVHLLGQAALMQKDPPGQAPEIKENRPFPWSHALLVQAQCAWENMQPQKIAFALEVQATKQHLN